MAITETLKALGSWSLNLRNDIPVGIVEKLGYFGHIVIHPGVVDPRVSGDGLLKTSRYTGVLRDKGFDGSTHTIAGPGMAMWLGDEDKKGEVFESLLTMTALSFENAIRAALPPSGSVTEGTLFNIGSAPFTSTFQYLSPREVIDYVCTTLGADWIVRGDATLDAGLESDLFVTVPKTAILRRNAGVDRFVNAFPGHLSTAEDVQDFTTRVVLLASGSEGSTSTGSADILPGLNPYKDLHGHTVKMTRLVSESSTDAGNATARAQLQLNRFTGTRNALTLSTQQYDIKGDVVVGDYLWVYDPESGLEDINEVIFRGQRIYPLKLRLTEMTWPVIKGMSVAYRDDFGVWTDLTKYVQWESGDTTVVVGGYNRSLTSGADGGVVGSRPQPNTSIPDQTVWDESHFVFSTYQSTVTGETKAQVELHWLRPNNVDTTAIIDGDHYDLRYRTSSAPVLPVTWAQIAGYTWNQVEAAGGTWDHPIQYTPGEWAYATVPWDQLKFVIQELAPNMPYEAQIRAVDNGTPANYGDWSVSTFFQTLNDTLPPAVPAPISTVAASTLSVQITHNLGKASGGTFNLDRDLHHLEVHGQYEPNFTPNDTTLLGRVLANAGMMNAQVPVVATFASDKLNPTYFKVIAVDDAGNKSQPSTAVQATALLVDDAHITNLTVTKVTAGTISANWLMAGKIYTGVSPNARMEIQSFGVAAWNSSNTTTFWVDSATGNVWMRGQLTTGDDASSHIKINPGQNNPRIVFYPTGTSNDHVDMKVETFNDPRLSNNTGIKISSVDSSGNSNGGEVEFGQTGVKMGFYDGSEWAYNWIDEVGRHTLRGTWNTDNFDSYQAFILGTTPTTNPGDGAGVYSYGITMASRIRLSIGGRLDWVSYPSGIYTVKWAPFIDMSTDNTAGFVFHQVTDDSGSLSGDQEVPGCVDFWGYRL